MSQKLNIGFKLTFVKLQALFLYNFKLWLLFFQNYLNGLLLENQLGYVKVRVQLVFHKIFENSEIF